MDLVEEGLEAVVFGEPCLDLWEECFGDRDRAGLARFFEGQVLPGVAGAAVVTATRGVPTAVGVLSEAGGQDRGGGRELFEAVLQPPEQVGGMAWAAPRDLREGPRACQA